MENVREEEKKFESNTRKLLTEITNESSARNELTKSNLAEVIDKIAFVQGEIVAERKSREDGYDIMIKRIGNKILGINETLNQERKQREMVYGDYLKLLNEIYSRFQEEISVNLLGWKRIEKKSSKHAVEVAGRNVF